MLSPSTLEQHYLQHYKMVWNLCYTFLKNVQDVEDAVQDTFLRLGRSDEAFEDAEHVKAWLIVTAKNVCRDELRRARRKNLPLEEADGKTAPVPEPDDTLQAVRSLPEKYRTVIYLHYFEGYPVAELARLLHRPESTVKTWLRRGRDVLRERLDEEGGVEK